MKQTTSQVFEQEIRAQIAAARDALHDAVTSGDALLVQTAENHLEDLVELARRNGVSDAPPAAPVPTAATVAGAAPTI